MVAVMETIHAQNQIQTLQTRMRQIRESRNLTLIQVGRLSKGTISAIALGSYERGDRSVSARKLIDIAKLYEIPVAELFEAPRKYMAEERTSIDIRKILATTNPSTQKFLEVLRNIARMRGDWNGEVISIRAQDIKYFQVFSEFTTEELNLLITEYGFPRSK